MGDLRAATTTTHTNSPLFQEPGTSIDRTLYRWRRSGKLSSHSITIEHCADCRNAPQTMFYYGTNIIWGTMVSVFFSTGRVYWLATVQGFGILAGGVLLWACGNMFQHWRWQMGLSLAWLTLFGGLLAYITPARQGCGVAFAFLSAMGFGYSQYLSITYIQFGADQVCRYSGN